MTSSLKPDPELEKEYQDYLAGEIERENNINDALHKLEHARQSASKFDVSDDIDGIHHYLWQADTTLADIGTNEEELSNLLRTGHKSEASSYLGCARLFKSSGYIQDVKEAILSFYEFPNFYLFKRLLQTVLFIEPYRSCREETSVMRWWLKESKISLSEIGTDETELFQLENPSF